MAISRSEQEIVDERRLLFLGVERIDRNISRVGVGFRGYVFGVSIGIGFGAAAAGGALGSLAAHMVAFYAHGAAALPEEVRLLAVPFAVIFGGVGMAWAFPHQVEQWNRLVRVRIEHEYEPTVETEARTGEVLQPNHVVLKATDGRRAEFDQPEPGAFARLVRSALAREHGNLVLREARQAGWADDLFRLMVQELRHIGWLHATETYNKAPVFTDAGKGQAEQWLRR